jgi:opacity protein-like surface antigen
MNPSHMRISVEIVGFYYHSREATAKNAGERRLHMSRLDLLIYRCTFVVLVMLCASMSARAVDVDITAFGGIQRQGKLTLQSALSTTVNSIRTINGTNFGVFGVRVGHGRIFGGEHTVAFSPNFIDADTKAFIYNSNVLLQAPLPVVRPYGTVGIGLIHTSGDGLGVFGTKFALNYGGGLKFLPAGPVGMRVDVRGYSIPSTEFRVFSTVSQRIDFLEVSVGVIFSFGK